MVAARGIAISAAMLVQIIVASAPTAASAFDIQGLIGTAIALQMGAYHGSPYHRARGHVASRRDDSEGNSSGVERDARGCGCVRSQRLVGHKIERSPISPICGNYVPSVGNATPRRMRQDCLVCRTATSCLQAVALIA